MNRAEEIGGDWRRLWLYLLGAVIAFFLIAPILIIVPMSFSDASLMRFPPTELSLRWYAAFFGSARWMEAAGVSFATALGTVAVATPAGTLAAYAVHTASPRLAAVVTAAIMAPLVVPIVLIGIGLYFTYARLGLNNTLAGLIVAHAMHATPYVFVTVLSALKNFDMNQPRVAQSLGASPARAFLTVTLPQIGPAVGAAAFLAFLSSFDEVVIALFISGGAIPTLPKLMFTELRMSLDPTITAVSSVMLALALAVIASIELLNRRQRRRSAAPS